MSTLYVDTIEENTSGNGIVIADQITGSGIAGHVVNYEESAYATQITLNNSNYVDVISTTITPKFQNSKFKVEWNIFFYYAGSSVWDAMGTKLLRGSTAVYTDAYALGAGAMYGPQAYMDYTHQSYFDTPNTTSPITYKIQLASYGGQTLYLQYSNQRSIITVTEIAQ